MSRWLFLGFFLASGAYSSVASAAPRECSSGPACQEACTRVRDQVNAPRTTKTTFVSHRCASLGGTSACTGSSCEPQPTVVGCLCTRQNNVSDILAKGMGRQGCLKFGRDHSCLYKESEFPGCDLAAAQTSCESACKDLEGRIQKEEQATHTAELKEAACVGGGSCGCVLKIGDGCYLEPHDERHDCATSADKIYQSYYPTSANPDADAASDGGCSVSTTSPAEGYGLLGLGVVVAGVAARRSRRGRDARSAHHLGHTSARPLERTPH